MSHERKITITFLTCGTLCTQKTQFLHSARNNSISSRIQLPRELVLPPRAFSYKMDTRTNRKTTTLINRTTNLRKKRFLAALGTHFFLKKLEISCKLDVSRLMSSLNVSQGPTMTTYYQVLQAGY